MYGCPPLVLEVAGNEHVIPCDQVCVVGSASHADIHVPSGPDDWLRIRYVAGWIGVVPHPCEPTLDGIAIPSLGSRTLLKFTSAEWQVLSLQWRDEIVQLRVCVRPQVESFSTHSPLTSGTNSLQLRGRNLIIGRQRHGAHIQISGDDVAARHAAVRWTGESAVVRDLGGGTGTYIDGQSVIWSVVRVGQTFVIGHWVFRITPRGILEYAPISKPAALTVQGLTIRHLKLSKRNHDKPPTLANISFSLATDGFMAIVGPSGAGKSTLFDGLLGDADVTNGFALLNDIPLGGQSAPSPALVSYVPQQNAAFSELTVRQTLGYCYRLRLAQDVPRIRRDERVANIMRQLQLETVADQRPRELSGGQVRRLNVAMELLTEPRLLMLDEPSSGLDEGLDRRLMTDLADLASKGCVVMIATHTTAHLHLCSSVLAIRAADQAESTNRLTRSGGVGYFGPTDQISAAFAAESYADVMDRLRDGVAVTRLPGGRANGTPHKPAPRQLGSQRGRRNVVPWRHAFTVNFQRDVRRLWRRAHFVAGLVVVGPAVAALFAVIASHRGLAGSAENPNPDLGITVAVICICLSFVAMALSLTSVVSDQAVIARERRWGVPFSTVILSRAASRLAPASLQATIAVLLLQILPSLFALPPGPEYPLEGFPVFAGLALILTSLTFASMCVGILISASARSPEQAVGFMAGSLAMMVILCGLVIPIGMPTGSQTILAWLSHLAPTRWAVSGMASYVDLTIAGRTVPDPMWTQDLPHFLAPIAVLFVFCIASLTAATFILRSRLSRGRYTDPN